MHTWVHVQTNIISANAPIEHVDCIPIDIPDFILKNYADWAIFLDGLTLKASLTPTWEGIQQAIEIPFKEKYPGNFHLDKRSTSDVNEVACRFWKLQFDTETDKSWWLLKNS